MRLVVLAVMRFKRTMRRKMMKSMMKMKMKMMMMMEMMMGLRLEKKKKAMKMTPSIGDIEFGRLLIFAQWEIIFL